MAAMTLSPRALAFVAIVAALAVTGVADAGVIREHYEFSEPEITSVGDYHRVTMDGAWSVGDRGMPVLPIAPARILLPPGEVVTGVSIIPGQRIELGTGFLVEPGQGQHPLSFSGPFEPVEPDYGGRATFPGRLHDEPHEGLFRGYSIATFVLHPVEFEPAEGRISYYSSIDVEVTTARDDALAREAGSMVRRDAATSRLLSAIVDNPSLERVYTEFQEVKSPLLDERDAYRYIIITTDAWDEYLDEFVDFQTRRGNKAGVFLKSWITSRYLGTDDADRIRRFIRDAYRTWGIDYVLLVGDTRDPDGIPHRGFFAASYGYTADFDIPADLYYAALDGTWNDDGDNRWGEPKEADLYPEVAVGRVCVNDQWDIDAFVQKAMRYQVTPVVADCDEALLVGEYLWPGTYGGMYKDEIRFGSSAYGYTTAGFPDRMNVTTLYEMDGDWSSGTVISLMGSGANIVNHLGHCNIHYVMKMNPLDISLFRNDGIEHTLNFVYSQGCYGGSFDNRTTDEYYTTDCFVEEFIVDDDGAAAMIANSRYGWGEVGGTNGSSQYYDREFFDALFDEGIYSVGQANNDSKADAVWAIDYAENRWCFYQLNLFGDPAMELWTAEPTQLTVDHPDLVLTGDEQVDVVVRNGSGAAVDGARVTISTDDCSVYDTRLTDGSGHGSLRSVSRVTGSLHLKVTAHNFLDYDATIGIINAADPYLVLSGETVIDDGTGGSLGNGDAVPNSGETVGLRAALENLGGGTAYAVVGTLSTESPFVTIIDAEAAYGEVPAHHINECLDPYLISIAPDVPDGEALPLTLTVEGEGGGKWEFRLDLIASAPNLARAGHSVDDAVSGANANGCAEAGETVGINVLLGNTGSSSATGVVAVLSTAHPFVMVDEPVASVAAVAPGETRALDSAFTITLLPGCVESESIHFDIDISANWGYASSSGFTLLTAGSGFSDDVEDGAELWEHTAVTQGFVDAWHVETERYHSAGHSWKFGGSGSAAYPASSDGALSTAPFCVAGEGELRFWDWLAAEQEGSTTAWDCALVEISADFGETWAVLIPEGGYTHTKTMSAGNPLPDGTPCWSGSHDWREEVFDLSDYGGESVIVRFRFASDEYIGLEGWYIDDVQLTFEGGAAADTERDQDVPAEFALLQNAPNPFNPVTVMRYELPVPAHVRIDIYNVSGRLVRTVVDGHREAGYGRAVWDGTDTAGRKVASGVYMYEMRAGDFTSRKMMVLLK
jgi:hypothetical protein